MSDSSIHPSYDVYIQTRDDKQFCINSLELCYHIELLRQRTADRWFEAYNTEYGKNINKNQLNTSQYASNCALVSRKKLVISSSSSETKVVKSNDSSKTAYLNDGHEGGGGSGDTCGDNGADGDGGGAGCAGCGDDGGGGDGGGAGCGGCGGGD
ncbi:unnamed protein product [Rotaria sp. Silwood1]|nr:unnamed protein product [Rotaria sp. Silwood1]